eukprot:6603353-Pyramimonas_sp.AAC.3
MGVLLPPRDRPGERVQRGGGRLEAANEEIYQICPALSGGCEHGWPVGDPTVGGVGMWRF